jgi:hypothetical protein
MAVQQFAFDFDNLPPVEKKPEPVAVIATEKNIEKEEALYLNLKRKVIKSKPGAG